MMLRTLLVSLAAALLLGASLHIAPASDEEPYPIWWSPELDLESLEKIDERLERPFSPGDEGFVMGKWDVDRYSAKGLAPNCATMIDLDAEGYSPTGSSNDVAIQMFLMAKCETITRLKDAKPAGKAF